MIILIYIYIGREREIHIYIYIYIYVCVLMANLPTEIMDFRGVDASIISSSRCGFLMSIGN